MARGRKQRQRDRRAARDSGVRSSPANVERYEANPADRLDPNPVTQQRKDVATVHAALQSAGALADPNVTAVDKSLRISQSEVARVIREAPRERDPAQDISGMAPNMGQMVMPQVVTIQGLASALSKSYVTADEAIRHSLDNARYMRNDPGIMECIEARQRMVALLDWHIEPEDKKDPKQMELAAEMEKIIRATPNFTKYRETLLHGIWYGRYANQHKYGWTLVGGVPRVTCKRWLPINGDKLVFGIEDDPSREDDRVGIRVGPSQKEGTFVNNGINQVQMTERGMAYFLEPWQRRLITLHKHQIEDGAYESPWDADKINGVGIRSKVYWDWFQKQQLLAFLMEYLERAAFGIELWYYPWGNDEAKAQTEAAAKERLGNGRSIVLVPKPLGEDTMAYGVEHIEPGLGGVESLQGVIKYFDHRTKRYILGQTLSSEADATGLGSGLSDLQGATLLDIIKYDATNLEESISRDFLTPLKDWNFIESRGIPLYFRIDTESDKSQEKMEAFEKAHAMGARIKEKDIYDLIGAGEPTGDDRILPGAGGGGMGAGMEVAAGNAIPGQGMNMQAARLPGRGFGEGAGKGAAPTDGNGFPENQAEETDQ